MRQDDNFPSDHYASPTIHPFLPRGGVFIPTCVFGTFEFSNIRTVPLCSQVFISVRPLRARTPMNTTRPFVRICSEHPRYPSPAI